MAWIRVGTFIARSLTFALKLSHGGDSKNWNLRCWKIGNFLNILYTAEKKRIYIFADLSKRTHVFVFNSLRQTIHYETCSASLFFVSYFATLFVFDVVVVDVVIKCQLSFLVLQLKWQTGTNRVSDRFIRHIIINFPYSIPKQQTAHRQLVQKTYSSKPAAQCKCAQVHKIASSTLMCSLWRAQIRTK